MNCKQCGETLTEDSKFCAVCGTPTETDSIIIPTTDQPVIAAVDYPFISAASDQPMIINSTSGQSNAFPFPSQQTEESVEPIPEPVNGSGPPPSTVPSDKKRTKGKPVLIAVIVLAVIALVVIAAIFIVPKLSGSKDAFTPMTPLLVVYGEDEVQIYAGDKKPVVVDGLSNSYKYSMDGMSVVLEMDADDEGLSTLVYCDGKKAVEVAEDVYVFSFSASGNKIIYLADYDYEEGFGDLYVYDIASKKAKKIVDEAYTEFAISPDGKSVAYTTDIEADDYGFVESFTGYVSINGGKAEELGENQFAFAIADGGKYIYYVETSTDYPEEGDMFIRSGKKDEKLGTVDLYSGIYLNSDCSDIMYVKGGSTYICVDAGEKEKISSLKLSTVVAPEKSQYISNYSNYLYAATLSISSFTDQLIAFSDEDEGGTALLYLKKDLKTEEIEELDEYYYLYNITLSQDGKSLRYINDSGKVLYYKNYRDLKANPVKMDSDEDVVRFVVMPDKTTVYYVDDEQTLWVQRGSSDAEEIESDVVTYSLNISKDGKGIYFISDYETADDADGHAGAGVLYYVKNAPKARPVEISDEAYSVRVSDYGTIYSVYDEMDEDTYTILGEVFLSQNDKDFDSIMDNAIIG